MIVWFYMPRLSESQLADLLTVGCEQSARQARCLVEWIEDVASAEYRRRDEMDSGGRLIDPALPRVPLDQWTATDRARATAALIELGEDLEDETGEFARAAYRAVRQADRVGASK